MSQIASYQICSSKNLIQVRITGTWTISIDLAYLSELSETMSKARNTPWAMVVDMRGFLLPEELLDSEKKITANIDLDRRNQLAECWIVDHIEQSENLEGFITGSGVPLKKVFTEQEASQWLASFGVHVQAL
ncbi:hypothetical protein KIH87_16965 [Paraneptunicella aestuarii]|uniref:hypothetical protein n=1 Tax=Paraneptunicella aestuarii TaxID=2831148 RepID=UPI001E2928A9|nr:hypothetical protein [Paraneptunicella aestuarii]UAA38356.1 hypothetical protein KIH87_16965 [Paraneptunicella aestuarii]